MIDNQFWLQKWEKNQLGFHQKKYHPYLTKYFKSSFSPDIGHTVFVPLCGKSKDMCWLLEQGYSVLGIELSEIAVQDFFQENNLSYSRQNFPEKIVYQGNNICLIVGDFYQLRSEDLISTAVVYDRASLISFSPELRRRYVNKLFSILPFQEPTMLITLEYAEEEMSGPPFSVREKEIRELFRSYPSITRLDHQDILDQEPKFAGRGVTALSEVVYWLE